MKTKNTKWYFLTLHITHAVGNPTKNLVVNNHEYILVYGKDKNKFKYKGEERDLSTFKKDEGGYYKVQYLQRFNQGFKEVEIELENKIHKFETPYTKEKHERKNWKMETGRIVIFNW